MLPPDTNVEPDDGRRHQPQPGPDELELAELRARVEQGSYEVRPPDVADAMLSGGGLSGFRLPRSVRQG